MASPMQPSVLILVTDKGWILERLASELAKRLTYVTLDQDAGSTARVRYYVNYHAWRARSAEFEVAFFTHLERDAADQERFFEVARAVDYRVCHSRPSQEALRDRGYEARVIPPGVDLDRFQPRLRIGVVGRTYKTGRKGEDLVRQVLDIPGIDWAFTGTGWPLPSEFVPDEALPAFYRSLDYLLVPSLYEAGPMCVPEAIACGVPVIAPPIGWIPEFPHLSFQTGDAVDLRRVLEGLVAEQNLRCSPVLGLTWDAFAEGHDRLFREILGPMVVAAVSKPPSSAWIGNSPIQLQLHGSERRAGGGPSTRVPRLMHELTARGLHPKLVKAGLPLEQSGGLVHVFNVWHPSSAVPTLRAARAAASQVVFSPIMLDLSQEELWRGRLLQSVSQAVSPEDVDQAFGETRAEMRRLSRQQPASPEPVPGFHGMVREMVRRSDAIIALSETERDRLRAIGAVHSRTRVIHNPVDSISLESDDLFCQTYDLRDYVLCVGRIEPRKNQLALIQALRTTDLPLVLLGHASNDEYSAAIERFRWPGLHVVGRIPHGSRMWRSALKNARVFALTSWAEGGPLAALEAAAAGLPLVLSDHPDEREYFDGFAAFVHPSDPDGIRAAIETDHASTVVQAAREERQARIVARYGWKAHVERTVALYEELAALPPAGTRMPGAARGKALPIPPARFIADVTTLANHRGRWTGIARLEASLVNALMSDLGPQLTLIAWEDRGRQFFLVTPASLTPDDVRTSLAEAVAAGRGVAALPSASHLLVGGSGWMQNSRYVNGLVSLVGRFALKLTPIISDVIPLRAPYWYPSGYEPVFRINLMRLLGASHSVLAVSRATAEDVRSASYEIGLVDAAPVDVVRLGDEVTLPSGGADPGVVAMLRDQAFVLAVGAIHLRKNYSLLRHVWRRLAADLRDECPMLVIVGGVAWNGSDDDAAFRGDRRISHLVHNLEGVDDATLEWLYVSARLTVYPSLDEGWGLPVAESLRRGVACLASDIRSVSEIAPGLLETLPPDEPDKWVRQITRYVRDSGSLDAYRRRISERYRGTDWSETARNVVELAAAVDSQLPGGGSREVYKLGVRVSLGPEVVEGVYLRDGWTGASPSGCRVDPAGSVLALALEPGLSEDLLLTVEFGDSWSGAVVVSVRDVIITTWRCDRLQGSTYHAVLPAELVSRPTVIRFKPSAAATAEMTATPPELESAPVFLSILVQRLVDLQLSSTKNPNPSTGRAPMLRGWQDLRTQSSADQAVQPDITPGPTWGMRFGERQAEYVLRDSSPLLHGATLELVLKAAATAESPVQVKVAVNGTPVAVLTSIDSHFRTVSVANCLEAFRRAYPVALELQAIGSQDAQAQAGLIAYRISGGEEGARVGIRFVRGVGTELQLEDESFGALGADWHRDGSTLSWRGRSARMPLYVGYVRRRALRLASEVRQVAPSGSAEVLLETRIDGRSIAMAVLPSTGWVRFEAVVPAIMADEDGIVELEWAAVRVREPIRTAEEVTEVYEIRALRALEMDGVAMEFQTGGFGEIGCEGSFYAEGGS